MSKREEILDIYGAAFAAVSATLPGSGAGWTSGMREDAMQAFRKAGFPTHRDEAWRYTDLGPMARHANLADTPAAGDAGIDLPPPLDAGSTRVVMLDGRFSEELSTLGPLTSGISFMSLAQALDQKPELIEDYLVADSGGDGIRHLNRALMADGSVIILEASCQPQGPLEILYLNSGNGTAAHMRNLVVLEAGAALDLIEAYRGEGDFWSNIVSTIVVGEGASLNHHQIQVNGAAALLSAAANVRVAEGGQYSNFVLTAGGLVTRNEIHVLLQGQKAEANLDGLCLARAGQSLANVTIIEHQSPAASSKQRYKSILEARASAAFLGKVVVAKDAQQSEAHQSSDSLLMGEGATANAKPELLIHADDVKCSHGATVGALDEAALFYLSSRGMDNAVARQVLVAAFAEEIIQGISLGPVREAVRAEVALWMRSSAEGESP